MKTPRDLYWFEKLPILGYIITTIEHIFEMWSWPYYFGFEMPWLRDSKSYPGKSMGFFNDLTDKKGCIRHCKICMVQIFILRLLTFPITVLRDIISRWIWRSKYTNKIRQIIVNKHKNRTWKNLAGETIKGN